MKKLNLKIKDMPYAAEEALNRLRVNIKFCGKNTKKIVITSSVPNEGKSTVSVRLWKLLSEAGFPTVLVDVDLRKSELQKKYQVEGIKEGLNHFLSGLAEYEDVVYETNIPNGHIVPVTTLLENPSALLEDPRLGELLDRLAEDYRYVIIDTPPLDNISDGALIASMSEWGVDIQTEHERYLTEVVYKKPVFVTDYPKEIKSFYMKQNADGKTVAAADMLVPGIGELIGGSQREEDYDKLVDTSLTNLHLGILPG